MTDTTVPGPDTPTIPKRQPITPQTLLERIPIAGLSNYFQARERWEKRLWAYTLIISAGITLYYLIHTIVRYTKFTTVVEIQTSTNPRFPVFHFCVNMGLNTSYIRNHMEPIYPILRNDSRLRRIASTRNWSVDYLIWLALGYASTPPTFGWFYDYADLAPIFDEIIYKSVLAMGDNWPGLGAFYDNRFYECDQVLHECTYQNVSFPCCDNVTVSGTDNTCFKIDMEKHSLHNDLDQSTEGKPAILSFRTTIDMSYAWSQHSDLLGIIFHFGNSPNGLAASPVPVPVGMHGLINIKPSKHIRIGNECIMKYRYSSEIYDVAHPLIQQYVKEMEDPEKYTLDICLTAHVLKSMYLGCGCVARFGTMNPNDSVICTPAHLNICIRAAIGGYTVIPDTGAVVAAAGSATTDVLQATKKESQECKPLCETWNYDYQITFAPLLGERGEDVLDENNTAYDYAPKKILSNQFVMMIDPEYRIEEDVYKIDLLTFVAMLGDGFALILGISGVTLVQAAYWGVAAIRLVRKKRRQVAPFSPPDADAQASESEERDQGKVQQPLSWTVFARQ